MLMITAQHLGQIVARLAIADENFMKDMLKSAEIAEKNYSRMMWMHFINGVFLLIFCGLA